jgi:hypothetical protein
MNIPDRPDENQVEIYFELVETAALRHPTDQRAMARDVIRSMYARGMLSDGMIEALRKDNVV